MHQRTKGGEVVVATTVGLTCLLTSDRFLDGQEHIDAYYIGVGQAAVFDDLPRTTPQPMGDYTGCCYVQAVALPHLQIDLSDFEGSLRPTLARFSSRTKHELGKSTGRSGSSCPSALDPISRTVSRMPSQTRLQQDGLRRPRDSRGQRGYEEMRYCRYSPKDTEHRSSTVSSPQQLHLCIVKASGTTQVSTLWTDLESLKEHTTLVLETLPAILLSALVAR